MVDDSLRLTGTQQQVSETSRIENGDKILTNSRVEVFAGALPHPDIAAAYENLRPGTFDEMVQQWTKQANHRREMERFDMASRRMALWLPLVASVSALVVCVGGGIWLVYLSQNITGAAAILTPIIGSFWAFVKMKPQGPPPATP